MVQITCIIALFPCIKIYGNKYMNQMYGYKYMAKKATIGPIDRIKQYETNNGNKDMVQGFGHGKIGYTGGANYMPLNISANNFYKRIYGTKIWNKELEQRYVAMIWAKVDGTRS